MKNPKYLPDDVDPLTASFTMRYWDRKEVIIDGTLRTLADRYQNVVKFNPLGNRIGPASLRYCGEEVGFINAMGEVYLNQPNIRRVQL